MYLISYGTRPELIKLFPLINIFKENNIDHKTIFTGQHEDLIKEFENLTHRPDFVLEKTMKHKQSINSLIYKIINESQKIINSYDCKVIIQGDAASSFAIALSAINEGKEIIHVEAGLRTHNLRSPFPEEGFRKMISHISNIHFCPTIKSVENLKNEGITENVHLVGNTIVDSCAQIIEKGESSDYLNELISSNDDYYLCTLHRRENINNFQSMWEQLNQISENKTIIYIKHPSVPNSEDFLGKNIIKLDPMTYQDMVFAINNSKGLISDSGGLQEEAICLNKNILICRDTSERPETIDGGFGKLIGSDILNNIQFLENGNSKDVVENPYGKNVVKKILEVLSD